MGKLFGTDGIRGIANEYPMTPEIAIKIGKAVALKFKDANGHSRIIIGRDTRLSGNMIEYALVSGICAMGTDALLADIMPTPGIAFLTSYFKANAGIMVSASHNPFYDNGIKIFNGDGYKLSDDLENEIEYLMSDNSQLSNNTSSNNIGSVRLIDEALSRYKNFLKNTLSNKFSLENIKIVIDCSNGATYKIAPELFADLGADIEVMNNNPTGRNINDNCGSEHTEPIVKQVLEKKADIGIAFDGDGDRLIAVDENGNILSGDKILAISAIIMKKNGLLANNHVVSTVMSNMGLVSLLKSKGINHTMSQVGDRYVMQEMIKTGAVLGGEDSGHIIFSDYQTTGDGILTALKLIQFMKEESQPLAVLAKIMPVYPQVLINIQVSRKPEIKDIPELADAIKHVENILREKGRVLVRYSGTQPLCRVMVEGESGSEAEKLCRFLADKVRECIG
ncbi:MAG: phosphoglucosamine mutase [Thermodesulfobacteriota bacterium]|nr:phosphoglucosamine mutase [Thermodesulfobacteriota bacterium]